MRWACEKAVLYLQKLLELLQIQNVTEPTCPFQSKEVWWIVASGLLQRIHHFNWTLGQERGKLLDFHRVGHFSHFDPVWDVRPLSELLPATMGESGNHTQILRIKCMKNIRRSAWWHCSTPSPRWEVGEGWRVIANGGEVGLNKFVLFPTPFHNAN